MAYPSPRNPAVHFPERVIAKVSDCAHAGGSTEAAVEVLSPPELLVLVLAALRVLNNKEGSSMNEIRRVLVGGGYLTPSMDVRPALVLGLKRNVIRRPLAAIKAGTFGKYVEVERQKYGNSAKRRKDVSGRRTFGVKVKRCNRTSKKSLAGVDRFRLAL